MRRHIAEQDASEEEEDDSQNTTNDCKSNKKNKVELLIKMSSVNSVFGSRFFVKKFFTPKNVFFKYKLRAWG